MPMNAVNKHSVAHPEASSMRHIKRVATQQRGRNALTQLSLSQPLTSPLKRQSVKRTKAGEQSLPAPPLRSRLAHHGGSEPRKARSTKLRASSQSGGPSAIRKTTGPYTRNGTEQAIECEVLRRELERVMDDHERQADEIVALRALARSLKEEVETMARARARATSRSALSSFGTDADENTNARIQASMTHSSLFNENDEANPGDTESTEWARRNRGGHEFFQLDAEVDALRLENTSLQQRLAQSQQEVHTLRECISQQVPRHEIAVVQAQAALQSTASQLREEQDENDRLRSELAAYRAKSAGFVGVTAARTTGIEPQPQRGHINSNQANGAVVTPVNPSSCGFKSKPGHIKGRSASMSASKAPALSSLVQSDLNGLGQELKRLHRSLDGHDDDTGEKPTLIFG